MSPATVIALSPNDIIHCRLGRRLEFWIVAHPKSLTQRRRRDGVFVHWLWTSAGKRTNALLADEELQASVDTLPILRRTFVGMSGGKERQQSDSRASYGTL